MQSSSHADASAAQAPSRASLDTAAPHTAAPSARLSASHTGSCNQPLTVPQLTGSAAASPHPSTSSSAVLNSTSDSLTGCSALLASQLLPLRSPAVGTPASRPLSSSELRTDSGKLTNAPSAVSSTLPQSSIANDAPDPPHTPSTGPSTRVHSGALVFRLTATLAKHDAPL